MQLASYLKERWARLREGPPGWNPAVLIPWIYLGSDHRRRLVEEGSDVQLRWWPQLTGWHYAALGLLSAATLAVLSWRLDEVITATHEHKLSGFHGERPVWFVITYLTGAVYTWWLAGWRRHLLLRIRREVRRPTSFRATNNSTPNRRPGRLTNAVIVGALLTGAIWGLTPPYFFPESSSLPGEGVRHPLQVPAGIVFIANLIAFQLSMLWTYEFDTIVASKLKRRGSTSWKPRISSTIATGTLTSAVSALLWGIYAGALAATASYGASGTFLATDALALGLNLLLLLAYVILVYAFFLSPLLGAHRILRSRTRATQRRVLRNFERAGGSVGASDIEAHLRLVEERSVSWPLPVGGLRSSFVAAGIPAIAFSINIVRIAVNLTVTR